MFAEILVELPGNVAVLGSGGAAGDGYVTETSSLVVPGAGHCDFLMRADRSSGVLERMAMVSFQDEDSWE